jgi:hypothetical protein
MALERFRAPALPIPNAEYDQRTMTDIIRALRLYFNQLDSLTPNQAESYRADNFYGGEFDGTVMTANNVATSTLTATYSNVSSMMSELIRSKGFLGGNYTGGSYMGTNFYGGFFHGDGRYLSTPYNQITSDQDQTGAVATATAVTFNTNEFPGSISIVSNSRITFGEKGIYLFNYSLAFTNPTNDAQDIDIWYRYKGTDIANSNSKFSIPARKSTGNNSYLIAVTPYTINIVADNDYVELMFRVTDATVTLEHLAAVAAAPGVTPAIPATPSVILTIQFVSDRFPAAEEVAPISVTGFGQIGTVIVNTTNTI